MKTLTKIWQFRGFILGNVYREFQAKYRNSLLGAAWTILHPLTMISVYTLIFSQVMHAKLPGLESGYGYSIYLCAGVLTWGLLAEIANRAVSLFTDNANLIKKINFPRLCLPITIVINALINFLIVFSLFALFLLLIQHPLSWSFLSLVPLTLLLAAFSIGLGISLGVVNVFFRDVGHLFAITLQFWFWLTPIVYPIQILPKQAQSLVQLNPIAPVIMAYQQVITQARWPDWASLVYPFAVAVLLCGLGLYLFRRHAGEIVDEL